MIYLNLINIKIEEKIFSPLNDFSKNLDFSTKMELSCANIKKKWLRYTKNEKIFFIKLIDDNYCFI